MMTRIAAHLKDRHKGLWDHFSIYLTPDGSHMRELEALVLRIVRPTGNSVSGTFRGATDLYRSLHRAMTVHQACEQKKAELAGLQAEERALRRRLARDNAELVRLAADATKANQIAALQDRIRTAEQRLNEIQEQMEAARRDVINERDFETALSAFNPVWETLSPREQARLVRLLVERVDYDGKNGKVAVTFRPGGIKAVAQQMEEEAA
jgi:flagellar biosynthesis chaperone FliJ